MISATVVIPQLGANEDSVRLVQWYVQPGQQVVKGQVLAALETTKASIELEAEQAGFVYPVVPSGQKFAIQEVVALLLERPEPDAVAGFVAARKAEAAAEEKWQLPATLRFTDKAKELVLKHKLPTAGLPDDRIIREKDLEHLLKPVTPFLAHDATRRVVIYGASQGGQVVAETIAAMGGYEVCAFLDDTNELQGSRVNGLPVWPGVELEQLAGRGVGAIATHIAHRPFRLKIRDRARAGGVVMLNVIHPRAWVAPSVRMGVGNVIKAGALLDTAVELGDCCIIDNGVIVAHHNQLGDACHLAPGVAMAGDCRIAARVLLGTGARISARITIGENVIVSPGAAVVSNLPDNVVAEGVPARIIGRRRESSE
jgi:UDP-perosamine 4-acetyltransferase